MSEDTMENNTKVFLSWSGETSQKCAQELKEFIQVIIQNADIFFSPEIEKGKEWLSAITTRLHASSIGLICVTQDNINSQWLNFEAGALSAQIKQGDGLVCPILFGIKSTDLNGPLTNFQMTEFNKKNFKKLFLDLNGRLSTRPSIEIFNKLFEKFWNDFESEISKTLETKTKKSLPTRTSDDMIPEILARVRGIQENMRNEKDKDRRIELERLSPFQFEVNNFPPNMNTAKAYAIEREKNINSSHVFNLPEQPEDPATSL